MKDIIIVEQIEYTQLNHYPDYYISKNGDIYSKKSSKFLKRRCDRYPWYETVIFSIKGKNIVKSVHRLVALTFISNPENKKEVNHKDFNKLNNHISNLEWVTRKENIQHAWDNNKMMGGKRKYQIRRYMVKGRNLEYEKTDSYKELNRNRVKKFIDTKPDIFKEIQKKYHAKNIQEVSDRYCINILRNKHSLEYIKSHPELIKERRASILEKRSRKKVVSVK